MQPMPYYSSIASTPAYNYTYHISSVARWSRISCVTFGTNPTTLPLKQTNKFMHRCDVHNSNLLVVQVGQEDQCLHPHLGSLVLLAIPAGIQRKYLFRKVYMHLEATIIISKPRKDSAVLLLRDMVN